MKKTLSLLLVLAMVLSSFGFAFAAEDEVVPAEFLNEKGILKGNASGDLMLEENLKRQDMIVMLSRLLGVEEGAKAYEGETSFKDVVDPFYVPYVAWAEANELTNGKAEGKFGFDEFVTEQQVAQFMLRALGYGEVAWDEVPAKAVELKLVEKDADLTVEAKRSVLAEITYKALGTKMKDSEKTLAEHLGIEMPKPAKPEKLEAEVLETENLAEVVVKLSNAELVKNKDALLNPANYRLNNDVKVQHVDLDGDNVILTLVPYGKIETIKEANSLVKGKKFNLTIRNIDPAINDTYRNILANDNAIPVVENVEFIGTHGIRITTSEPIANPFERNFRLDSRTAMIVEQYGREIILTPYHGKEFDKEAVEITIDGLKDFAGYTSVRTVEKMEVSTDEGLPTVDAAYRNGKELTVVFDRDVYHDSITPYVNRRVLGNVSFVERRVPFYAEDAEKVDTNVVKYTFGRDIPRNIEVTIEGVANHFNKAMEKEVVVPEEFRDDYAPAVIDFNDEVEITDAKETALEEMTKEERKTKTNKGYPVDTQELAITFDKDIAEFIDAKAKDIDVKDYFTLYELDITRRGKDAAEDVKINVVSVENDTIELTFEGIKINNSDRDFDYILEVRNFSDTNRNRMEREYLDFQVVRQGKAFNVEKISIKDARYFNRDGAEIVLEFSDYVNKEKASDANNYYLDGSLDVDEAIVERDGKTVSLVVYDKNASELLKKYGVLEISPRVQQLDWPYNAPTSRFWDLKTKTAIKELPTASAGAITYTNADTTKLVLNDKDELDVSVSSTSKVKVNVIGEKAQQVDIKLFDAKGKVKVTDFIPALDADGKGSADITIPTAVADRGTYKLVAKILETGETKELTINVLNNKAKAKVYYGEDGKSWLGLSLPFTPAGNEIFVAYDADLVKDVKLEDFNIVAEDGTTIVAKNYIDGKLTVIIESEDKTDVGTCIVDVKNAAIETVTVTSATAADNIVKVKVVDELGKEVKTLEDADFTITEGVTGSETNPLTVAANGFTNNNDGTYTIVVNEALTATTNSVKVDVNGVSGTVVVK